MSQNASVSVNGGVGLGNILALGISYLVVKNTLGWVVLHALFGWFYVIYYFLTRA